MKNLVKRPTKAKKRFCVEADCKSEAVAQGYCRLHYLANNRLIRLNRQMKAERRLNAYVDQLARKYPKDYLEKIKEGIESEDKFKESIQELDLDADHEPTETEREYLEKFLRDIKNE